MLLMKRLITEIEKLSDWKIWLIFFLITLAIILMVQLVMLPYILPFWHAGDGLLTAGRDTLKFHETAVEMAEKINIEGWSAWELRPEGWMPAGLAGAIYALTWPEPWTLAPVNAAVHAFTALLVIKLLYYISGNRMASFIAAIPYVFFPSAMLWYTQIHRDGYNILGMLLLLYGLLLIIKKDSIFTLAKFREGQGLFAALCGVILLWLSRPHTLVMFQYVILMLFVILAVYLFVLLVRRTINWERLLIKVLFLGLVVGITTAFYTIQGESKYEKDPMFLTESSGNEDNFFNNKNENFMVAGSLPVVLPVEQTKGQTRLERLTKEYRWARTSWLPARIDNQFYSLAILRSVAYPVSYGDTASEIDSDVSFHSAVDFVYYLPRALQISFLAPFPGEWFGEGTHEETTFFRRISAFEMSFIYLMLIPMCYGLWIWRRKIEIYIMWFYCIVMMLPIVYSIPNVGTIYRYRYGYLMLLVSFGVVALYNFIEKIRQRKNLFEETG